MIKYSKKSQDMVEDAMHRMKKGDLKSSSGDKVTNPKQAIAIGLSEARDREKVPEKSKTKASSINSATKKSSNTKTASTRKSTAGSTNRSTVPSTKKKSSIPAKKKTAKK